MKINIIVLSDSILMGKKQCPTYIEQKCVQKGLFVNKKMLFPSYQPDLEKILRDEFDCCNLILVEDEIARVNESLAALTQDVLQDNQKIKDTITDYYKFRNIPLEKKIAAQWNIPSHSRAIICEKSCYQGYMLKGEREDIIVLSLQNFRTLFDVVYDNIWITSSKCNILKTFGLSEANTAALIGEYVKNKDGIKVNFINNDLETDILIKGKKQDVLEDYTKKIFSKVSKFVYAEDDVGLYSVAFRLLLANNLTVSFAESVTGGNLVGNFIKFNQGASKVLKQSFVVYSDQAKKDVLGVSDMTLRDKGAVSVETAYEMATGLLKKGCDIAVATTGYAGEDTSGEVYIAVGDKNEIHVYKNVFCMNRESAIENICKATNFYLIKKLRSNDFGFEKNSV